jgi:hypothetical protein
MAGMTVSAPLAHRVWDAPRIRMPAAEVWARLDEAAQDRVMDAIEAVFDEHREAMSEGVRHSKRKTGIAGDLDAHFRRAGRGVLLASELAVLYPGEAAIVPDVLAVMDVDPDDEPERWVVTRERRGVGRCTAGARGSQAVPRRRRIAAGVKHDGRGLDYVLRWQGLHRQHRRQHGRR